MYIQQCTYVGGHMLAYFVCVYVCVCVCVCVCKVPNMHVRKSRQEGMYVCMDVHVYTYMYPDAKTTSLEVLTLSNE